MVLKILPHARQLVHDPDAEGFEQCVSTDAGKLEQLRRLQGAGAEDDLPLRPHGRLADVAVVRDADRATTLEQHLGYPHPGLDSQIAAMARRREIGIRRAAPPPISRAEVVVADAFLGRAVEVVVSRNPEFRTRSDDSLDQLVPPADRRTPQRAAEAVVGGVAACRVLEALEIGQDLRVTPAVIAEIRPAIVILSLATNRYQPVDRARSAECLAARPVDPATVHPRLGFGVESPVA